MSPSSPDCASRLSLVAGDGELKNFRTKGANPLYDRRALRAIAGAGEGDNGSHTEQVALRIDQQISGRDGNRSVATPKPRLAA